MTYQAKYVGHLGGGISKNLFLKVRILIFLCPFYLILEILVFLYELSLWYLGLELWMQDKKHRYYIVSALAATTVDLKGLLFF